MHKLLDFFLEAAPDSYAFKELARGFGYVCLFTFVRWAIKEHTSDKFDSKDCYKMCKFCQIIADKKTLTHLDDKVGVLGDANARASSHLLVVPVTHIKNINKLTSEHIELLRHMKATAHKLLPDQEIKLGFHRVFSTSIDHLHMHAFSLPLKGWYARLKYSRFFFVDVDSIID